MLLPVKGEVISDCRENADPAECSPARFVTTATDARIIMQTSAPNENHMKVKTLNTHTQDSVAFLGPVTVVRPAG